MNKALTISALLISLAGTAIARSHKTLSRVMTLKIEHRGGANGAAVAWDPEHQRYYAAMAGNTYFPLFIFNAEGKRVCDTTVETMFDVRGLWYNTATKTIQSNGYKDFGLAEYTMDEKGLPESVKKIPVSSKQPNDQSPGAYDTGHNAIYFYDYNASTITREDFTGTVTTFDLHLGVKKKRKIKNHNNSAIRNNFNENVSIATGIPGAEVGLLDAKERQIELYSLETGLLKKVLNLPADAPVESSLNFSYCNGIYWLFDRRRREWRGYQ